MAIPRAPLSTKLVVSVILPAGVMFVGSVTLRIWTPLSSYAATAAYIVPFDSNMVMSRAPLSCRVGVSMMLSRERIFVGSVMLRIWTPSFLSAATAAYVLPFDSNVVISYA